MQTKGNHRVPIRAARGQAPALGKSYFAEATDSIGLRYICEYLKEANKGALLVKLSRNDLRKTVLNGMLIKLRGTDELRWKLRTWYHVGLHWQIWSHRPKMVINSE